MANMKTIYTEIQERFKDDLAKQMIFLTDFQNWKNGNYKTPITQELRQIIDDIKERKI